MTAPDPLLAWRAEFPILGTTTYLVSNSLGAMPRGVPARLAEYASRWAEDGVRAWGGGWWEMPVAVGNEIAPLLGAADGEVAMVPNVTAAQALILSAIDFRGKRDTIVMTELDFPSVRYVTGALAARFGARVVVVPSEDGMSVSEDAVIAAIDERTALVAISHVLFRSAYVMEAAAIVRAAHERGALVALDAFHAVGVLPVDVKAIGADFLTGGVLKWLCGGPGGCFVYVAPRVRDDLEPALAGWQGHARPFAFEPTMTPAPGIARWLGGTPAIPALYAATEGPRILRRAGIDAIRAKSIRQTSALIALADARGYPVSAPRASGRRGGTVAFDVPHAYEVSRCLLDRGIIVDYRPGAGIRVAPHFYTSDAELEQAVGAIDEIIERGDWQRHAGRTAVVT
ncbi:MAG TPA: aminotransferase class V-fold PLP-dependent enzyme [Gemmatimonadaceae bacterium]|nr:aminotransferase class V-fold PLP-dependent enzyme [Gemmatimonadaceae bacterium]